MLIGSPTPPMEMNHLTALFPYNPRAYIATKARLLNVFNPFTYVSPDTEVFRNLASTVVGLDTAAKLNRLLVQVSMAPGKYQERAAALEADSVLRNYLHAASWFSMGVKTLPLEDYVFGDETLKTSLTALMGLVDDNGASRKLASTIGHNGEPGDERDYGFLSPSETSDLMLVTLALSFSKMMSSFLTAEEDTPKGSPKDIYPIILRVSKTLAFITVLRQSIYAAHLREHALFFMSPLMAPFLKHFNKSVLGEIMDYCHRLVGLKLHPWIAQAMRPGLPAVRPSPVGERTASIGLADSAKPGSLWGKIHRWQAVRSDSAMDMREMLLDKTDRGLVMSFHKQAEDFFLLRDAMNQDYIKLAEGVLNLDSPSAPVHVHLHGQAWRAVVMTGAEITEPLDIYSLLFLPRYPAQDAEGSTSMTTGAVVNYEYDASKWTSSGPSATQFSVLTRPPVLPPLYVSPHRRKPLDGFGLGQVLPEMIQPKDADNFFGDDDADTIRNTIEAVAAKLGYRSVAELAAAPLVRARLTHLFTFEEGSKQPWIAKHQCPYLFTSQRTNEPWRKAVSVPSSIPGSVLAMDARTAPIALAVNAVVARTPQKPTLLHSTLAEADALAVASARELGFSE